MKKQPQQSSIAQRTGGAEAEKSVDWDWVGQRDLIQIKDQEKLDPNPLTFDTGVETLSLNDNLFEIPNETGRASKLSMRFSLGSEPLQRHSSPFLTTTTLVG